MFYGGTERVLTHYYPCNWVIMFVIVPNYVSEAIYKKVDVQLEKNPHLKEQREKIYNDILNYFNEHGKIPDFELS